MCRYATKKSPRAAHDVSTWVIARAGPIFQKNLRSLGSPIIKRATPILLRTMFQVQDQLAQSETNTATALVAVYKALGGGWER